MPAAGVDIVLGGHLHEYERSHALFVSFLFFSRQKFAYRAWMQHVQ